MVGIICPLVEIGLTDLSKTGGAQAPPAPPLATDPATIRSIRSLTSSSPSNEGKSTCQLGAICQNDYLSNDFVSNLTIHDLLTSYIGLVKI